MKKVILILLTVMILTALAGCNKNKDIVYDNGETSIEETINSDNTIETGNNELKGLDSFEPCPPSSEWENVNDLYHIQMIDMLFSPDTTTKDLMQKLDESKYEYYIYDYDPNELILSGAYKDIIIYVKDYEETLFNVRLKNASGETTVLENTKVTRIYSDISKSFWYILDGKCYEDFIGLTYEEIKVLANNYFNESKDFRLEEEDNSFNSSIPENHIRLHYYHGMFGGSSFNFYVDKTTGLVDDMDFNFYLYWD